MSALNGKGKKYECKTTTKQFVSRSHMVLFHQLAAGKNDFLHTNISISKIEGISTYTVFQQKTISDFWSMTWKSCHCAVCQSPDQRVIDTAIRECRKRLQDCTATDGEHFANALLTLSTFAKMQLTFEKEKKSFNAKMHIMNFKFHKVV